MKAAPTFSRRKISSKMRLTEVVPAPDEDTRWDYKRAPVERIYDAVRTMLLETARGERR